MLRGILGIVAGAIAWMAVFYALVILLSLSWPEYGLQGRTWMTRGVFTFTPSMACFNLLFWALAEIGAGWVAMKVARRPRRYGYWPACWAFTSLPCTSPSIGPASPGGTTWGSSFRLSPLCYSAASWQGRRTQ